MKTTTHSILLLITCLMTANAIAQNTFPATGRAGIYTTAPAASLHVNGGARIGRNANYVNIDSATGNLSFVGNAAYRVGGNKYAFQYSGNPNYGLYFNQTNVRYEFRNSAAAPTFFVGADNGNGYFFGSLGIGTQTPAFKLDVTGGDASINGVRAGRGNGSLAGNTVFGTASLAVNTTGFNNTAFGESTLALNTTGTANTATGFLALFGNTTGYANAAFGYGSLYTNSTGINNTAVGNLSLSANTTGSGNTATGAAALLANVIGNNNTATGQEALANNLADNNTANGFQALKQNTTGTQNTATGYRALLSNTTGIGNIAIGHAALQGNTTGSYNIAFGDSALASQTATPADFPNVAIGSFALMANNGGYANTAIGYKTLFSNTLGYSNTANGSQALYSNTTGGQNTSNGFEALYSNTTGNSNTANGDHALTNNSTGSDNAANGTFALASNTTGGNNTANGELALRSNTTGNSNTGLGYLADVISGNLVNATAIGANVVVDASNKVRIGDGSVTSIGGQVGWTNFSDGRIKKNIKENVPGLAFINLLKPVTYQFNLAKEYELMGKKDTISFAGKNDIEKVNFTGFVAQDVDAAAKKINYDFSGVDKSGKVMGLRYSEFVVPLVKAVQELSQGNVALKTENDGLKNTVDKLQAQMKAVLQKLDELQTAQQQCCANTVVQSSALSSQSVVINDAARLEQNAPNPFKNTTIIKYHLPATITNSQLVITDNTGKAIKSFTLSAKGSGQVSLDAGSLAAGTYYYSLLVNGKKVDAKKMEMIR